MEALQSPYERGSLLGRGAFGEVHEGTQSPHGKVAIKTITRASMETWLGTTTWEDVYDHVIAEGENLKKAEHPNVVRVYGVGHDAKRESIAIVTELCDGSVHSAITSGPLTLDEAVKHVRAALLGLESLHLRGMIHRDLKPANLLLKKGVAKLSDFGLVTDTLIYGYASHAGYTPHLAPEVLEDGQTSHRSDVWAMGLTIYRMLNGEPWYDEEIERLGLADPEVARELVVNGDIAHMLRWMPHVPPVWQRFVRAAIHESPTSRPADGGTMLTKLNGVLAVKVPNWRCEFGTERVEWSAPAPTPGRQVRVQWDRSNARKNGFRAWMEDTGGGNEHVLKRSRGPISETEARSQLAAFFGTRTK